MENYLDLRIEEMMAIEGGAPFTYYIGLVIGATAGTAYSLIAGLANGFEGEHK